MIMDNYSDFLDKWFSEIEKLGIDISDFNLDHLGYSVDSEKEYDETKSEFLSFGKLFRSNCFRKKGGDC